MNNQLVAAVVLSGHHHEKISAPIEANEICSRRRRRRPLLSVSMLLVFLGRLRLILLVFACRDPRANPEEIERLNWQQMKTYVVAVLFRSISFRFSSSSSYPNLPTFTLRPLARPAPLLLAPMIALLVYLRPAFRLN